MSKQLFYCHSKKKMSIAMDTTLILNISVKKMKKEYWRVEEQVIEKNKHEDF